MSPQTDIVVHHSERGHERLVRAQVRAALASALLDRVHGRLSWPDAALSVPELDSVRGGAGSAGPDPVR